jgi:hypothetical protein
VLPDVRGLLLKVEKRVSHHYQFLTSYTLSFAKDGGFSNALGDQYGFVRFSRWGVAVPRHRLVVVEVICWPTSTRPPGGPNSR